VEGYIGEIRLFAGNFAPKHWRWCDGSNIKITDNTALFSVIGSKDDVEFFHLPYIPDLQEGLKYIICVEGLYPSRS